MAGELTGSIIAVTGAASGIGRAIALELAAGGANLLLHTRLNAAGLAETAAACRDRGAEVEMLLADFAAEETELLAFCEEAWKRFGPINHWVHNAGADVLTGEAAGQSFAAKLELLWRVDVRATLSITREMGRRMVEQGSGPRGIITLGWDQAATGMAGDSGEMFAAIKGAVMAYSRSLARSLAPHVRVNCVAPGWIRTSWGEQASDAWQRRAAQESLLGRWGAPDDVAGAIRFLCSPAAAFVNGQVLCVNGGFAG